MAIKVPEAPSTEHSIIITSENITMKPHPLEQLSIREAHQARDLVRAQHKNVVIDFRTISLEEPPKVELQKFLALEHSNALSSSSPRPVRLGRVHYDVIGASKVPEYHETVVDILSGKIVSHEMVNSAHHASLTL